MFEKVCEILADKFDADASTMTMDTKVKEDLNADSLDVVELMMDLEENFGVTISDEEAAKMSTIGDIVNYIEANQYGFASIERPLAFQSRGTYRAVGSDTSCAGFCASAVGGHTESLSCIKSQAHVLTFYAFAGKRDGIRAYARSAAAEPMARISMRNPAMRVRFASKPGLNRAVSAKKPLFREQWLFSFVFRY